MAKGAYIGAFKPEYEPIFKNNSWAQIIKACQKNEVPSTWVIGSQKDMTINGTDYAIDIIGKNHDDYSDGSGKAPLTFQLHDIYDPKLNTDGGIGMNTSNTNSGGWTSCKMRTTYLPDILILMPSEVQAGIKEVNKKTSAGSQSSTINTTADKLFLLSEIEVFGSISYSLAGEGTQYDYYKAGNSAIKKLDGTEHGWWERSPRGTRSNQFCHVSTTGTASFNSARNNYSISFAFCFGGTSQVNNTFGGSSVARKIKKGYVGIENLARKIKKAYIGIGGVARPCWSGGELAYYGKITDLKYSQSGLGGATAGNKYALFAGGMYNTDDDCTNTVNAYDASYTHSLASSGLSTLRYHISGASAGDYAIFAGGRPTTNYDADTAVDAYNSSLTKNTSVTQLSGRRCWMAGFSFKDYALFCGGTSSSYGGTKSVYAYNSALTRSTPTTLSNNKERLAGAAIGNYAIVGGGYHYSSGYLYYRTVDAFDPSFTRMTISNMSSDKMCYAAASTSKHVIFAGGEQSTYPYELSSADCYDDSLTKVSIGSLSVARTNLIGASIDDFAIFAGGQRYSNTGYATVERYDSSLTRTAMNNLSEAKCYLASAVLDGSVFFAGGSNRELLLSSTGYRKSVDVFKMV